MNTEYKEGDIVRVAFYKQPEIKISTIKSDCPIPEKEKELILNALVVERLGSHAYIVAYVLNGKLTTEALLLP